MRTRIFFAIGITSVEEGFLPDAEGLPHHIDDFAQGRLRPHRVEDEGHRVRVAFATLAELVEGPRVLLDVSRPPDAPETFHLGLQGRLAHSKRFEFRLLVDDEVVHADNHPLLVLDLPLIPICGVGDLLLEEPFPDRGDHAAELLNPIEVSVGLILQLVREGFEEVGPAERIDRVRDAALVGEDLLGSERDAGRGLGRHLIGLVVRVRMEGLRPAEDRGERLDRRPDDVDLGLLRGQADAGRLRVVSEEPRTRVLRAERVPHLAGPDPAGRAVLREFLEQIVVRVEEERQAGREVVHLESAVHAPADVFHAVRQGEGQLLSGGRPCFANVIAADRNRVPLRYLLRAEFERVDDEAHGRFRREDPLLLGLIFFQDVVLDRAAELRHRDVALRGRHDVHGPDHGGRTVSPASVIWAMYLVAAEERDIPMSKLRGTIQNDILKEYQAQKEWIFPPEPSMRLVVDTFEFGSQQGPQWNTISISGYHIREAGATAGQELAFT